jgi:hypothetical protein
MVFHHLFDFPDRIHVPYISLLNFSFIGLESLLASFGRICVAIFAFNSGYGMRKSIGDLHQYRLLPGYKNMACRLWSFAQRFWIVLFVFVGIGLFTGAYNWDAITLLKSFLGRTFYYNAEWWYVAQYIRFLLIFPLLIIGLKLIDRHSCGKRLHSLFLLALIAATILLPESYRRVYLICFLCGSFFASVPIFECLDKLLSKHKFLYIILSSGLLGAVFVARAAIFGGSYDFLFVPLFVFGFVGLLKCQPIRKVLGFVLHLPGKYSTYIWLTHTFFGYYLFQKITFFPRYSLLIFLWCMVLSIVSGWILESALTLIHKGFKTLKERSQK